MTNKLIIAAAGSGKTTLLVHEAMKCAGERVLVTTYTQANEAEIRRRFVELCGCVPAHVKIQTWFSFLIQHGAKPFQGKVLPADIKGLLLVNEQSASRVPESQATRHYLAAGGKVYSDKLSKLAARCNERSEGQVVDRIARIFPHIFVDEVQDLAGYDLEMIKALLGSNASILLVGDPRKAVYATHDEQKHKKYKNGRIRNFIDEKCGEHEVEIDDASLSASYRSHRLICEFSDLLYPAMRSTISRQETATLHDGVFLVRREDVGRYLEEYQPTQLRYSRGTAVDPQFPVFTFGDSKGLSRDRVLIYPTKKMASWSLDLRTDLAGSTRAKLYVAITRARHSVGIVCEKVKDVPNHLTLWQSAERGGHK